MLGWSAGGSGSEVKSPTANVHGDKPWLNDDPATPNNAFIKHVDELVAFARERGLILAMLPTWGYYVNDARVVQMGNARAYGRWLGARYRSAPNIVWVNGGDRVATGYEEIMTTLRWWELSPDQGVFATGVSSERTLNTGMRSHAGDRVVAYLSSQCTVFLQLDKIASARARATWISPTTGERKSAGSYRTGNLNGQTFPDGQSQFFTTPGHWEDAVLLLEAE